MIEWLRKHFQVSSTREKVAVGVVRAVFDQKFTHESNKTFGKAVRKAFPEVNRGRDGGGYVYSPLKWRTPTEVNDESKNDKGMQTSLEERSSPKEVLKTTIKDLKSKCSSLEKNERTLKREHSQLKDKYRQLKTENIAKRRRTEGEKTSTNKLATVNMITHEDLEVETSGTIGEGTYGQCNLMRFKRTRNLVVVKKLKTKEPQSVLKEATYLQTITSDRFPYFFGVQLKSLPYCIVMEFIGDQQTKRSSTLHDVVASKEEPFRAIKMAMTQHDWLKVCLDIAEGLRHLHSLGILHCDLKSNNVLVHQKRGFVIDLGKACEASSPPQGKRYTEHYRHISPEVLKGGCFSFENDIFSFGKIVSFVRKFCNINALRSLEDACLNKNYVMRPTAELVVGKFANM